MATFQRPFTDVEFETTEQYTTRYLGAIEDVGAARGFGAAYDSAVGGMGLTEREGRYGGLEIEDPALSAVKRRAPLAMLNEAPTSATGIRAANGLKVIQKYSQRFGPWLTAALVGYSTVSTERAYVE
eukprot:1472010-Prymnesium_polylepis.1